MILLNKIANIVHKFLGFLFLHPYTFLPAPHNFLNPETDLNLLLEKGHSGYRN